MPDSLPIYHFTHIANLPNILEEGALLSDSLVRKTRKLKVEVGDREVKSRRRLMRVKCAPGGCPADYVPFYFAPRSPMLYVINRGNVPEYKDGQDSLVYLVGRVDHTVTSGIPWVFTDGNCAKDVTEYFNDISRLEDSVDWPLMKEMIWRDTAEDPDRMRRRMAEFLVHERFPIELLVGIATKSNQIKTDVDKILEEYGKSIYTAARSNWYY